MTVCRCEFNTSLVRYPHLCRMVYECLQLGTASTYKLTSRRLGATVEIKLDRKLRVDTGMRL
jgi:hypothetical protein